MEVTWKSSRVFAMRCPTDMSTTGSRPTSMGPLIAAVSAVHHLWVTGVCVSYLSPYPVMGICLAFSLMSNFPANPIQSYPALTFSQSMVSTAPCRTVRVCLTGFCISQLWSYITWLLVHAVTWAYKKVPTEDLQVVYLQFVFPHIGKY